MQLSGLLLAASSLTSLAAATPFSPRSTTAGNNEQCAHKALEARRSNLGALRSFVQPMPKGADLHNHLDGTPFAEDLLSWAADLGVCLNSTTALFAEGPCGPGTVAVKEADQQLYDAAIDAVSLRYSDPATLTGAQPSGHDRFFATFGRSSIVATPSAGKELAAVKEQAALDSVSYVEIMVVPPLWDTLAAKLSLASPLSANSSSGDFTALDAQLEPLLLQHMGEIRKTYDDMEAVATAGCPERAGCGVEVRYLATALRLMTPAQVYTMLYTSFALQKADERFVGVQIAQAEDGMVATRDYTLHMRMFRHLHQRFPAAPAALHAGELVLGTVHPRDMRFHIREAVEVASARRIGHGVSIGFETNSTGLLAQMRERGIAVEINLSSNDAILGIRGEEHPFQFYRAQGVATVLSTDDSGVLRNDLSNEFLRAVSEHGLAYAELKQLARNSLHYSFLDGSSLWKDVVAGQRVRACVASLDDEGCKAFVKGSARAQLQKRLEDDLARFEASLC
ncbi:uncharacterized protein PFL1_05934 [Pseudozyma flocculosa PF-1]|nr:uncharacterized protein PFL1_05934 [Pseudozyma flocculosa PF-1]EPQ26613.1 hypothetical protein PFL1_05934 [Pseudozyma flocculosa PF-1]